MLHSVNFYLLSFSVPLFTLCPVNISVTSWYVFFFLVLLVFAPIYLNVSFWINPGYLVPYFPPVWYWIGSCPCTAGLSRCFGCASRQSSVFLDSPNESYRSRICGRAVHSITPSSDTLGWVSAGRDYSLISIRNQKQRMQNQDPATCFVALLQGPILSREHSCNPLLQVSSPSCQLKAANWCTNLSSLTACWISERPQQTKPAS